ncbi:MATE family multidrug resistance protein [Planomicrobium stackebrandtii]|uniref:Probable multidrug resistance protein NorM n=1 Tax=Planomicrobium stackebrandtii TaxID=253160 RepID=A0ABU0GPT2_9BACL|nr:MATE family efflux transporter [Planomicrobium stackebrandtii]MDQ0427361.1 MATE family multidrug resistance protein [Planomicrobium stackebrandtii]
MNHRTYLALAIPLTISTVTTPLLGAVDTAVVGQLPNPAYIGGVAIGTVIFNTLYWLFGFLRIGTSGFTAQAHGANDQLLGTLAFIRPLIIALAVGIGFWVLQKPIEYAALSLLNPAEDVAALASDYFGIRIWGVPFTLVNYVIMGWLIGMSRIKISVMIQVLMNLLNIGLDVLFVFGFGWGVSGVASATLIAEVAACLIGLLIVWRGTAYRFQLPSLKMVADGSSVRKMMAVNQDLFIRTICLLAVFNLFTYKSAAFGTETLAANAVLLQIHYLMAYFYDGLSNASSILSGKAIGSKNPVLFKKNLKLSFQWAFFSSLILTALYWLFNTKIFSFFTAIPEVIELGGLYGDWLLLFPLVSSFGIVLYGVFTGATETAPIRNSMLLALGVFLLALWAGVPLLQNHGVWLAFILFSLGRSVFLILYIPRLKRLIKKTETGF